MSIPNDELAHKYDIWYQTDKAHWEQAPGKQVILNALKAACPREHHKRLLDIGCGTGSFLARIEREVSPYWSLQGIDFSSVGIEQGRRLYPSLTLTCADATQLDFEDGSLDIVICYGSWEHFQDPTKAIGEAARVLVPGGWVLAMIPALGIHRTDRWDEGWYEDTKVDGVDYQQEQWNLTRKTWTNMFEKAGVFLLDGAFALQCMATKPEVFFFGVKFAEPSVFEASVGQQPLNAFEELSRLANLSSSWLESGIDTCGKLIAESLMAHGTILVCGNGGSAADAQHFVAELIGHMTSARPSIPAISLATDPSVVTALANDYGYERVFARQIEGLGNENDVLMVISTSGYSANIIEAVRVAKERRLRTIAILGAGGDSSLENCDVTLHVPSNNGQRVQEIHTVILHSLCERVEQHIYPKPA